MYSSKKHGNTTDCQRRSIISTALFQALCCFSYSKTERWTTRPDMKQVPGTGVRYRYIQVPYQIPGCTCRSNSRPLVLPGTAVPGEVHIYEYYFQVPGIILLTRRRVARAKLRVRVRTYCCTWYSFPLSDEASHTHTPGTC